MDLLPGLPNHIALECLIRLPLDQFSAAASVCKAWKAELRLPEFLRRRKASGLARPVIVVVQERVDLTQNPRPAKHLAHRVYRLTLFDLETGRWSELPPVIGFPNGLPMFCHVVGVGSELLMMGGCDPVTWQISSSVCIYNFVTGKWRRGVDMPGGQRLFFGCASDSDRMVYVAGGHDDEKNALRSVMAYDVAKGEWVNLPDMEQERDECEAVFHRGKLHVIGGYPTSGQGRFDRNAEAFDVKTWQWDLVHENFLDSATRPRKCVDGGDGRMYTCRNGNVMAREGATWQVTAELPTNAFIPLVMACQGNLSVIGYESFGGPITVHVMDLKKIHTWTKLELPEEYSGHVQSGCFLEI